MCAHDAAILSQQCILCPVSCTMTSYSLRMPSSVTCVTELQANKIGKINLAAIGKDLMEDDKPGDVTIDLYAALDMESDAVAERSPEVFTNQKLGLLIGFLAVDDW
jgi:hypothetical protein